MPDERAAAAAVVDLNSDLGEGFGIWTLGDDDALLDVVTSANVACGFHAGDPNIMRRVCEAAAAAGLPSAPKSATGIWPASAAAASMSIQRSLTNDVIYQIGALDGFARVAGARVTLCQAARRALQPGGARR